MPLLPHKPEKPSPKLTDMLAWPRHDQPCKRIHYSDSKSLFEMLMNEGMGG